MKSQCQQEQMGIDNKNLEDMRTASPAKPKGKSLEINVEKLSSAKILNFNCWKAPNLNTSSVFLLRLQLQLYDEITFGLSDFRNYKLMINDNYDKMIC
mgnify:CR=1 FL=1